MAPAVCGDRQHARACRACQRCVKRAALGLQAFDSQLPAWADKIRVNPRSIGLPLSTPTSPHPGLVAFLPASFLISLQRRQFIRSNDLGGLSIDYARGAPYVGSRFLDLGVMGANGKFVG